MTDTVTTVLDVSAAAFPTLTVLVGILLNRNDVNRIDARISALETSLRGEISSVALKSQPGASRHTMTFMLLLGRDKELDQRITRLENRS